MELCFWPTCLLISKLSCTLFLHIEILIRNFNGKWTFTFNWCRKPWWQAHSRPLLVEINIPGILEVANEFATAIIFHFLQHNKGLSNSQLWTTLRKTNNKLYSSPVINNLFRNMRTVLRNMFAIQLQFHSICRCFVYHLIKEPVLIDLPSKKWLIISD